MDVPHSQVFAPSTLAELYASWARFPDAVPYAGGSELARGQGGRILALPKNILALSRIDELRRVSRTERYLEIGATASLEDVARLGKIVPSVLRDAIAGTANPAVRAMATVGGNLACAARRMACFAPLVALDARIELRTASASRWIAAGRFASGEGAPALAPQELVTRIRIPLENWDYSVHRRLGRKRWPDDAGASFAFVARSQKGILSDVRLAFAGRSLLRDREIDNAIIGKELPLEAREAASYLSRWEERLGSEDFPTGLLRDQFLNLVEEAVVGLTD